MSSYVTRDQGGCRLAWLDAGSGAPLVFLHAFPLNATMWQPQLDRVPAGWRALAPDLRGFRASWTEGGPPARHVADHAADVLALMRHTGAMPAVLVGLSMGGYIAFECWRQQPDAVAGLVLADTRAEADTDEARAKRRQMQDLARSGGAAAVADAMLPALLGATSQTTDPHRAVEVRRLIEGNRPDAIVDALEVLATRPDSRDTLPRITCPALVLVGEEDSLTPPPLAAAMASALPDATLVTIPRAGHLSSLEHPLAFNRALHEWLHSTFHDGPTHAGQVQ